MLCASPKGYIAHSGPELSRWDQRRPQRATNLARRSGRQKFIVGTNNILGLPCSTML
ncbi:hypothetical protein J6590_027517 [Homalodisca vitripennis]|nr:hypothetical protein J6590_027517 [Homalodisca vitripennis]